MNKVLLVTRPDRDTIEEADALARAAGYQPVGIITQGFLHHAKYGVGSGKAEELAQAVKEKEADLILFDSELRASQAYQLAKLCKVEVKDREKVILEIFAMRASTAEAKLQVQLAELEYEIPRSREKVKMARQGEQPGFFGLGKYEADVYTRMMKSRVSTLKKKVDAVAKRREIFREHRRKLAFPTIALAGYTAAGKTSLFNLLTGETKSVDAGVFTTLAPTTRAVMVGERKTLLTDTVGFISNLPAYLIESFKSTLEEISYASVVFLLLDVSQSAEKFIRSFESSAQVLTELMVSPSRVIFVLNKCDLAPGELIEERKRELGPVLIAEVSSKTGQGVAELLRLADTKLNEVAVEEGIEGKVPL
ncbi:MAG TPA: GTPase HflX [Nitrososphaerales archaeon]|nr:GTPase HflX [Nitrososphaerales archaeon]